MTSPRMKHSIDRATFTITFERAFAAPREDVFAAWTQPEQVSAWWDPSGTPLSKCTIDLRPGGAFEFVNRGHSPPFAGVYRVVEPPSLLVFDAMGAVGTVRLEGDRGKTNMTVTIRCASAEHLEQLVSFGVAAGTDQTLDNLVAHVTKKAA
jgi:uncharacterized protein YndB with AHSA1/START domain